MSLTSLDRSEQNARTHWLRNHESNQNPQRNRLKQRQKVYKPRFIVTPPREIQSTEEEEFNSEIETLSSEEDSFIPTMSFEDHLNSLANHKKNGLGPKIIYE